MHAMLWWRAVGMDMGHSRFTQQTTKQNRILSIIEMKGPAAQKGFITIFVCAIDVMAQDVSMARSTPESEIFRFIKGICFCFSFR